MVISVLEIDLHRKCDANCIYRAISNTFANYLVEYVIKIFSSYESAQLSIKKYCHRLFQNTLYSIQTDKPPCCCLYLKHLLTFSIISSDSMTNFCYL